MRRRATYRDTHGGPCEGEGRGWSNAGANKEREAPFPRALEGALRMPQTSGLQESMRKHLLKLISLAPNSFKVWPGLYPISSSHLSPSASFLLLFPQRVCVLSLRVLSPAALSAWNSPLKGVLVAARGRRPRAQFLEPQFPTPPPPLVDTTVHLAQVSGRERGSHCSLIFPEPSMCFQFLRIRLSVLHSKRYT